MSERFPAKDPAEQRVVMFDFSAETTAVTLPAVTISVDWSEGVADTTPSTMLSGAPQVDGTNAARVLQRVVGGLDMHDYAIRCEATDADGNKIVIGSILPVRSVP